MKFSIFASILLGITTVSASYTPLLRRDDKKVARDLLAGISGTWVNELGSHMNLTATSDGFLSGNYSSAVGVAVDSYVLTGRFDTAPPSGTGVSIGWVVTFHNSELNAHSTTGWSGQFFAGDSPQILTQWLLTTSTTLADVWESTQVGHDEFTRVVPSTSG